MARGGRAAKLLIKNVSFRNMQHRVYDWLLLQCVPVLLISVRLKMKNKSMSKSAGIWHCMHQSASHRIPRFSLKREELHDDWSWWTCISYLRSRYELYVQCQCFFWRIKMTGYYSSFPRNRNRYFWGKKRVPCFSPWRQSGQFIRTQFFGPTIWWRLWEMWYYESLANRRPCNAWADDLHISTPVRRCEGDMVQLLPCTIIMCCTIIWDFCLA